MGQYFEKQKLSQLIQDEIDNSNILIVIKKIELITKKFPQNKYLGPDNFIGEFRQIFKEEIKPILHNLFQKKEENTT